MLDLCLSVDLNGYNAIDLCGTGGDNKDTFNISTVASFVVAGAGFNVAKHGNYGVSSLCGSSNVLEYLGVKFINDSKKLKEQVDRAGICVLHAPLFHPAMKFVGPIRKDLAFKTFFNILGPMVNPANPHYQMVGVYSLELARLYSYLYQKGDKNYIILHSLDGYDEVSLTSSFKFISNETEQIIEPQQIGFNVLEKESLSGGHSIGEAAKIFLDILNGKGTKEQNEVVIANAAMAINCCTPGQTIESSVELAKESLLGKKALNRFNKLLEIN